MKVAAFSAAGFYYVVIYSMVVGTMRVFTLSVITALLLVTVIFSATIISLNPANDPTTEEALLPNGLIASIHFVKNSYIAFDWVEARYELQNPTSTPITFTPPSKLDVETGYEGGRMDPSGQGEALSNPVVLNPGESYLGLSIGGYALTPGRFIIVANGTKGTVEVKPAKLVAQIRVDGETCRVGSGGVASLVIYNPGKAPASYPTESVNSLWLSYRYSDEDHWHGAGGVAVEWVNRYTTVQPGESHVVWEFYFPTTREGTLLLDIMGVYGSVKVS